MFMLAIAGMIVYAITETGFAALIKPLLDRSFVDRDPEYVKLMPLAILGIFFVRGIASFVSTYFMAGVGRRVIKRLRGIILDDRRWSIYRHGILATIKLLVVTGAV